MHTKKYGIDLDGVTFDFKSPFVDFINKEMGLDIKDEDITSYFWYTCCNISHDDFYALFHKFGKETYSYRSLKMIIGAFDALWRIKHDGHEIHYVTNRPEYAREDTRFSLMNAGLPDWRNLHISNGKKSPLVNSLNLDVFIDDSPYVLEDLSTNSKVKLYCMHQRYNESCPRGERVHSWHDMLRSEGIYG